MVKKTWGSFPVLWSAFALCLASTVCQAQAQAQARPPPRTNGEGVAPRHLAGGAPVNRPPQIHKDVLNNPTLKLTIEQRARINTIAAAYLQEKGALRKRLATSRDLSAATVEAANRQSLKNFNAAVSQVLDGSQRKIWEASLAKSVMGAEGLPASVKPGATGQEQRN